MVVCECVVLLCVVCECCMWLPPSPPPPNTHGYGKEGGGSGEKGGGAGVARRADGVARRADVRADPTDNWTNFPSDYSHTHSNRMGGGSGIFIPKQGWRGKLNESNCRGSQSLKFVTCRETFSALSRSEKIVACPALRKGLKRQILCRLVVSGVLVSAESLISRISPRKQNHLQNHFSLLIRGPGGFDTWQKSFDAVSWRKTFNKA